jgi:uncharacterized protein YodC (DUF2158 family)
MSDFAAGCAVKLKSSGLTGKERPMDISKVLANGAVECVWIDDVGVPHRQEYPIAILEKL